MRVRLVLLPLGTATPSILQNTSCGVWLFESHERVARNDDAKKALKAGVQ